MSDFKFHAPEKFRENAWIKNMDEYKAMYKRSIDDPEGFWSEIAETFYWECRPLAELSLRQLPNSSAGPLIAY